MSGGELIHEKSLNSKFLCQTPFKLERQLENCYSLLVKKQAFCAFQE
jgi:hypothetical protein